MNLSALLRLFPQVESYDRFIDQLAEDHLPGGPLGVLSAARPAFLAALHAELQRPLLVITARADRARVLTDQTRLWAADPAAVIRLPDPDALPYERVPWGRETVAGRLSALTALARWLNGPAETGRPAPKPPLIITSARALLQKTVPPAVLQAALRGITLNQRLNMNQTVRHWLEIGYRSGAVVESVGQFSRRGGILDIFPPSEPEPVRIELFGDEIDSLRSFNPITQRSEGSLAHFVVGPTTEALPAQAGRAVEALQELDLNGLHPVARINFQEDLVKLTAGESFDGIEFYLPFFYHTPASMLEYLPAGGLLCLEDPAELAAVATDLEQQAFTLHDDLIARNELIPGWPQPFFTWAEIERALTGWPALLLGHAPWPDQPAPEATPPLQSTFVAGPSFGGQVKTIVQEVINRRKAGERVVLVSRQAARLSHLLAEQDVLAAPVERLDYPPPPGSITVMSGALLSGWLLADGRREPPASPLTVLSDAELFGWRKPQPRRRPTRPRGVTPETFFSDVAPGDYVVHIEHGIGAFRGLVKLDLEGVEREYLAVDYAQGDKLYVPIHQADRLSRYVGLDDALPGLHRLGAADWATVKRRARRAVEEIAKELLEIYAAREVVSGRAFGPDVPWQHELEAAFPYVETEDQLQAIAEVKRDMERPRPMDRLICGDVGYGKTEVALRAAFKAVNDGVQVAMLVPTTVLAQQHFETFRRRLAPFPVTVEMLSRFRTRKEQEEILAGLGSGSVDIVIGTHRLLQDDISFKNLGLLVIDEEQRFGVSHKEKLKQMRTEVDVLTLSATPIPRTLHMALAGVRDMSTIDTPPQERLSIKTTVAEYDETLIRTAILREIDRGGQVYFVHNRVMGIEQMANRLRNLVPEVNIVVAHGQMPERLLERVMLEFAAGEFDVLVSTTIIESGLDIPNVNTIIINRADSFGLAQLYQLRGRVGRSAVRAYAYLLIPKHYQPNEISRKRLEAIAEASELGAGFRIAMQDLEIRGAGELLGARQHGHIAAVGFDLYTRLLAQAVRELRHEAPAVVTGDEAGAYLNPLAEGIQLNLPQPVYLPEDYVPDARLRLRLYRRLAGLMTETDIEAMRQELVDRFGELPPPAENLLYQIKLKILALEAGVQAIATESGQLVVRAESLENLDRDGLQRRISPAARVTRRQVWLPLHPDQAVWQGELERILRVMGRLLSDPGR